MAGTDQNTSPAFLTMDARKFLRAINTSAQSKVVFFEESIRKMGQKSGKNYRLTALDVNSLIFEDVGEETYYHADLSKKGRGKIEISNIRPIKIVDEQKSESFDKNCLDMVESLSRDDFKGADKAFKMVEVQRFRPVVIPQNGWVTTKDRSAHHIVVEDQSQRFDIAAITQAFCEAVSEFVELDEDGKVIRGEFPESGETFSLPVNEMTRRRLVAKHMKSVAEGAWHSDSFKKLVNNIAGNVTKGQIDEAVKLAASFLKENQEFSLLKSDETRALVENALAAVGQFNSILAEDVSTLIYRTNLKVNKDDICESWEKTALKAENAELLHGAKLLESTEDFAVAYDKFLDNVLNEGTDVQSARAKAYLTSLKVINSILGKMEGKEDLATQVENMIAELEEPEPSTDIVLEAEQLLCSIPDALVDRIVTLENYSEIPGTEEVMEPGPEGPEGPAVSLPSGGGGGAGGLGGLGGGEPGIGEAAGEGKPEGEEEVPPEEEEEEEEEEAPLPESKQKTKATIVENMNVNQLKSELDHWKTDGHIYLAEDGFEDCNKQFARYIKRCEQLDKSDLREEFEKLRDVMIETGDDVIDDSTIIEDPYASFELGEDVQIDEEYGASMGKPNGHGVPTGGKAPSSPPSAKPASGDHKMGKPQGKGVAGASVGDAEYSSGTGQKMGNLGGKGVQKKGLGDAELPAENEDDPDDGKPPTGSAQMGRPQGKGVAESVGNPEKVQPGTGKQLKGGGWIDKLDEKLGEGLKSMNQGGDKLDKESSKLKGGVAEGKISEGEVPEAFKKQWKKKDKGGEAEEECDTPGEKKRSGGMGKGLAKGQGKGPIGEPTSEDVATILMPFMEGKELTPKAIAGAILKLKEEAKSKPELQKSIKILEAYGYPRGGSQRLQCDFCDEYSFGREGDICPECAQGMLSIPAPIAPELPTATSSPLVDNALEYIAAVTGADAIDLRRSLMDDPYAFVERHREFLDADDERAVLAYGEEGAASAGSRFAAEGQYKGATKGMRPIGFKKSAIKEWLSKDDLSNVIRLVAEARAKLKKDSKTGEDVYVADENKPKPWEKKVEESLKVIEQNGFWDSGKDEDNIDESIEILRSVLYEDAQDEPAEAQKDLIRNLLESVYSKSIQEAALAVFADDESIDTVINAIVNAMGEKGEELTPMGADTIIGDIGEGEPETPAPEGPEEGPGEGPGEGPPAEFQFGAEEEEAGEEEEEAGEAEEEAGEEEEEATED